jgi:predicted RNA-binding protein
MCEFTVYDLEQPSKRIAEDIVKATTRNGCLTLRKVLGESTTLNGAAILEVDVSKEQMITVSVPLLGSIFKLVELLSSYKKNPTSSLYERISSQWTQAKSEGDLALKSLKKNS